MPVMPIELLTGPWWQGVAGLAQIIAVVFSVWAIRQANLALRQSDAARREAVAPAWDLVSQQNRVDPNSGQVQTTLQLLNTGAGSARNCTVAFTPSLSPDVERIECQGTRGWGRVIVPGDVLYVYPWWRATAPPTGSIAIRCESRIGQVSKHQFRIRFSIRPDGGPDCDIASHPQEILG
jgi:hypothetical protein